MTTRKILCLHGGGQSIDNLKYQLNDIINDLNNIFTFDFLEAPNTNNTWWNDPINKTTPTQDENHANDFLNDIDTKISNNGPYYGLLGYSQGVAACIVYLSYRPNNNIQRTYLFNGYVPITHHGLMKNIIQSSPFSVKSLIFIGKQDYNFYNLGLQIKSNDEIRKTWPDYKGFNDYVEIISDKAGHNPPTKSDPSFKNVINFFRDKPQENEESNNLELPLGLSLGIGIPILILVMYIIIFKKNFKSLLIISYILIVIGLVMIGIAINESVKGNQFFWATPWIPLIGGISLLSYNV